MRYGDNFQPRERALRMFKFVELAGDIGPAYHIAFTRPHSDQDAAIQDAVIFAEPEELAAEITKESHKETPSTLLEHAFDYLFKTDPQYGKWIAEKLFDTGAKRGLIELVGSTAPAMIARAEDMLLDAQPEGFLLLDKVIKDGSNGEPYGEYTAAVADNVKQRARSIRHRFALKLSND